MSRRPRPQIPGDDASHGTSARPGRGKRGAAASAAMEPGLAAVRAARRRGLAQLDDEALAGFLLSCQQVASWSAGMLLDGIAEFADRRPDEATPRRAWMYAEAKKKALAALAAGEPVDPPGCDEFTPDELYPLLRLSKNAAAGQVHLAEDLRYRLRMTMAALLAGQIDLTRARIISEGTTGMSAADAAAVEAMVLASAGQQTYVALGTAVAKAVMRVDPDGAIKRRKRGEKRARVERWREHDGTGALAGRNLPPDDTIAADQALTELALELRAAGLDGPLDFLRATALMDLIIGRDSRPDESDPSEGNRPESGRPDGGRDGSDPDGQSTEDPAPASGRTDGVPKPDEPAPGPGTDGKPESSDPGRDSVPVSPDEDWDDREDWPDRDAYVLANHPPPIRSEQPDEDAPPEDSDGGEPGNEDGSGPGDGDDSGTGDGGVRPPKGPGGPGGPESGGPGSPESGDPGGRRNGGRDGRRGRGKSIAAQVTLTIPLTTQLGLGNEIGDGGAFGPLDADAARDFVRSAAQHPATRWCVTVTDRSGRPVAHGCARGPQPWIGGTARDGPGNRDGPVTGDAPPGQTVAEFLARLGVRLEPIALDSCDHLDAEAGYVPSRKLRHKVHARTPTCSYWGCRRPAARCDDDHTLAWGSGGLTCQCNLAPLCRRHHRMKQRDGWRLEQPRPGIMSWRTPGGRTYVTTPATYLA